MSPLQLFSAPSVVRHDGCVSVCLQLWRLRRSFAAQNRIICRRDLILQAEMKPVVGIVVSNKMQKSVVVAVDRLFHNKVYNRFVKRTSKFMAHGEADKCNISDMCFTWICEERLMNFINAIVRRRTGELKGEMGDAKIHYGWRIHQL